MMPYNFIIGPCDTDSISFCKSNGDNFSHEEINILVKELNDISPEFMQWENDGYFSRCVALKAKNYVLWDGKKKTIKGSAFKDGKKELALREFLQEGVDAFINDNPDQLLSIYQKYIKEAANIQDISRWTVKKTITKPVLNNDRTTERKIREAVEGQVISEGMKIWVYAAIDGEVQATAKGEFLTYADDSAKMIPNRILKTPEKWSGDQDTEHYIKRVYDTLEIFKYLIDIKQYPKYHLKKNKQLLKDLCGR